MNSSAIKAISITITLSLFLLAVPGWAQQKTLISSPVVKNGWVLEHATQTTEYIKGRTKVTFNLKVRNATGGNVDSPNFGAAFTYNDGEEGSVSTCVYFPKQDKMSLFKNGSSGSTQCGIETDGRRTLKKVRFFYRVGGFRAPEVYFNN